MKNNYKSYTFCRMVMSHGQRGILVFFLKYNGLVCVYIIIKKDILSKVRNIFHVPFNKNKNAGTN